jgi:hypothetical protein
VARVPYDHLAINRCCSRFKKLTEKYEKCYQNVTNVTIFISGEFLVHARCTWDPRRMFVPPTVGSGISQQYSAVCFILGIA